MRPNTSNEKKHEIVEEWYREELKKAVPPLIAKWEPIIGVKVKRFFAQRMKTKWGSCRPDTGAIRFNTELAKKPPHCLEYILVHELIHLREPRHTAEFTRLLAEFMPRWRFYRAELNQLPVRHEEWNY